MHDALDEDRQAGARAEVREGLVGQGQGAEHRHERLHRGHRGLLGGLGRGEEGAEHRVRGVVGDAVAGQEGEVGATQVPRAPAEHRGVDRDHQRGVPGGLGAPDQRVGEIGHVRPVQLVPAGPADGRDRLQVGGRLGGQDHRHTQVGAGPGDGGFAVRVHDVEHAERAGQHRVGHRLPDDRRGQVALGEPGEHALGDAVAVERRPVRRHGVLTAGAAVQVVEGLGRDRVLRGVAQRVRGDRDRGPGSRRAAEVDRVLYVSQTGHGRDLTHSSRPPHCVGDAASGGIRRPPASEALKAELSMSEARRFRRSS